MHDAVPPRWWQWPTMLSLDATFVAMAWQPLLARTAHVTLGWSHAFVLGASVWLAYAADRWFEGWRLAPEKIRTQRHRFYQQHRWPVAVAWALVLVADVAVAFVRLGGRELAAGFALLAPVLAYLLSHQLVHRDRRWRAPKEVCIAFLLAGGVAVFVFAQPTAALGPMLAPLALFTLLCFANVALISAWEHEIDATHGQTSLARQFRRGAAFGRTIPWLLAAVAALIALPEAGPTRSATLCVAGSSLLLGALDRVEPRLGPQAARVLADAALLTPVFPWLVHRLT